MNDTLLIAAGIIGFALIVLPSGLMMRGFQNLKDTWLGKRPKKNQR